MKERLDQYKNQTLETWGGFSKKQKILIGGAFLFLLFSLALVVYWAQKAEFVPLYNNLSPAEAGEIVSTIESQGVEVQISDDGTSVSVPKAEASRLKVDLAHSGIPRSGNINYGIFSENMSLGVTDKQFDVIERDAMQTELGYLIERIDGIDQAKVMITLPAESVWLTDNDQTATASVVLLTRPGLELNQQHVNGLHHLVSKSVPNLPVENIVIMDQHGQALEMADESEIHNTLSLHQQQREIKRDIERDIQRDLQQMLGTIVGMDKVVVSVFANVDFTKENREEHLVEPVDEDRNEGIAISVERIQEAYTGEGSPAGGVVGTNEPDVAGYPGAQGGTDSEYEKLEERINREVNRIHRQIEAAPYRIEDLTINVGVERPGNGEVEQQVNQDDFPETLEHIENVVTSVVSTSLSLEEFEGDLLAEKINVFEASSFDRPDFADTGTGFSNGLVYGLVAALVLALGSLAFTIFRRRTSVEGEESEELVYETPELEEYQFEGEQEDTTKKRMEKLAKENPEEFAKLLKSWMSED